MPESSAAVLSPPPWHTVQDVLEHVAEFTGDLNSLLQFRGASTRALVSVKQVVARSLRRHSFAVEYAEDKREEDHAFAVVAEPLGPADLDALNAQVVGARGATETPLKLLGPRAVRHAFGFLGDSDSSNAQLFTAALVVLLSPLSLRASSSGEEGQQSLQLRELHRGSSIELPRLLRKRWTHFAPALASSLTQLWLQPCKDSAVTVRHDESSYVTDGLLHQLSETLAGTLEVLCISCASQTTPGGLLALTALTKLKRLYLRGTEGVTDLVVNSILAATLGMEHLTVAGSPITENAFDLSTSDEPLRPSLTSLDASCCIYLGSAAFVASITSHFPNLAVLLMKDSGSEVSSREHAGPDAWSALYSRVRVFAPHAQFRGDIGAWTRLSALIDSGRLFLNPHVRKKANDAKPPPLKHLSWGDVDRCGFTPRGLRSALSIFGGAPALETLAVDNSRHSAPAHVPAANGPEALFPAAESFAALGSLRTLVFLGGMTTGSCVPFFTAATGLTAIALRFDAASSVMMLNALAAALPQNQLRRVDLDNVRVDALVACDLVGRHCGSLSALRLRVVGGIDDGEPSRVFGASIGRCSGLRLLDIDAVMQAGERDLACLAPIGRLSHLNEFALTANGELPDRFFAGASFPRLRCLRVILLGLSDSTVALVCRKFPLLEDFRFVIAKPAALTDDGIQVIAQLRALRTLAFVGCPKVSRRGLLKLKRALPKETQTIDDDKFLSGHDFRTRIRIAPLSDNIPTS